MYRQNFFTKCETGKKDFTANRNVMVHQQINTLHTQIVQLLYLEI